MKLYSIRIVTVSLKFFIISYCPEYFQEQPNKDVYNHIRYQPQPKQYHKDSRTIPGIASAEGIAATLVTLENMEVDERNPDYIKLESDVLIPAQKFIIVSPEYNGSIPGVLKSLIDISEIEKVWWGKKVLLVGISSGRAGNLRGMDHLTAILQYVKMVVHPNKLPISSINKIINSEGRIYDPATLEAMTLQLEEFIHF